MGQSITFNFVMPGEPSRELAIPLARQHQPRRHHRPIGQGKRPQPIDQRQNKMPLPQTSFRIIRRLLPVSAKGRDRQQHIGQQVINAATRGARCANRYCRAAAAMPRKHAGDDRRRYRNCNAGAASRNEIGIENVRDVARAFQRRAEAAPGKAALREQQKAVQRFQSAAPASSGRDRVAPASGRTQFLIQKQRHRQDGKLDKRQPRGAGKIELCFRSPLRALRDLALRRAPHAWRTLANRGEHKTCQTRNFSAQNRPIEMPGMFAAG